VAWKINVGGVENLAEAARRTGARLYHVSTDYVFDGKNGPYAEDDRPDPLSYYGKTKLASENALRTSGLEYFIARTMVLYGYAAGVKPNFALWLIQSLEQKAAVRSWTTSGGTPPWWTTLPTESSGQWNWARPASIISRGATS
jgi:dTDP-4-dehydrorhamnose reductase